MAFNVVERITHDDIVAVTDGDEFGYAHGWCVALFDPATDEKTMIGHFRRIEEAEAVCANTLQRVLNWLHAVQDDCTRKVG